MSVEVKVPSVGESIYEVTIGDWLKGEGDWVDKDEPLVALETDKASLEVPAPRAGRVEKHVKKVGDSAEIGEVIAMIDETAEDDGAGEKKEKRPEADEGAADEGAAEEADEEEADEGEPRVMPAARRLLEEHGLDADEVEATGPGGRLLKEDVLRRVRDGGEKKKKAKAARPSGAPARAGGPGREEEVVPMSPLRRRIAERLVESQQTTAGLTTFNEIDMSAVMDLRAQYKEKFRDVHGIKLGFMSFFVKAAIEALKGCPEVNAEIRGDEIVYRNYYDIGVAVGGGRGLVVPILRNAERMSFAEVELAIADFAKRAQQNKLRLDELQGGTFTISNGGVYGSLLSTPIINPPQVGILGMHNIQPRPVAIDGEVVVRPMMYVALSYDHRIVDGREAVTFLLRIKDCVENPNRILLEV